MQCTMTYIKRDLPLIPPVYVICMCVDECVCACMHACARVCVCVCVCVCLCVCVCVCTCVCVRYMLWGPVCSLTVSLHLTQFPLHRDGLLPSHFLQVRCSLTHLLWGTTHTVWDGTNCKVCGVCLCMYICIKCDMG